MGTTKITTKQGRIFTLTIESESETHITGTDKFGDTVVLPKDEINKRLPIIQ